MFMTFGFFPTWFIADLVFTIWAWCFFISNLTSNLSVLYFVNLEQWIWGITAEWGWKRCQRNVVAAAMIHQQGQKPLYSAAQNRNLFGLQIRVTLWPSNAPSEPPDSRKRIIFYFIVNNNVCFSKKMNKVVWSSCLLLIIHFS